MQFIGLDWIDRKAMLELGECWFCASSLFANELRELAVSQGYSNKGGDSFALDGKDYRIEFTVLIPETYDDDGDVEKEAVVCVKSYEHRRAGHTPVLWVF